MTRARGYALAVLFGACCLGHASAYAQSAPPGSSPNGYLVDPNTGFDPNCPPDGWYGDPDDVEASVNRFGPRVYIANRTIRVEYLNWSLGNPGDTLLGAPVAVPVGPSTVAAAPVSGNFDPTHNFVIFAPGTTTPVGYGAVPTTNSLNLNSANGVQVTGAWDFIEGNRLEVSGFMFARRETGYTLRLGDLFDASGVGLGTGVPGTGPFIPVVAATSTLFNGQLSDHLFLYNKSFTADYVSQFWGTEANYFMGDAVDWFQFQPLVGARYMNLTETFTQTGVFQDSFTLAAPISSQIGAHTINNLYGGQIGFRSQVVTKWLEFGVTPKLLFLGNTAYSSVYAARFRSNTDPTVFNDDLTTRFTFGADLGAFASVQIAPNFWVRGGYNLLWINQVTRPHRDIYYNDNGLAAPAGIGNQTVFHDIFMNGFSFGCELRF